MTKLKRRLAVILLEIGRVIDDVGIWFLLTGWRLKEKSEEEQLNNGQK